VIPASCAPLRRRTGRQTRTRRTSSLPGFIDILSHDNREAAKKSWDGLRNDPEFKTLIEKSARTTTKAEWIFVTPTDYSPLK